MAAKAIFITGGASGIGQAVAKYFAAKGWRVGLADVNAAGLEATAAMLPAGMATTHLLDVRDRGRWADALAEFAAASGGRLDVLFNNAGIAVGGPFADTPPGSCLINTASAAGIYGSGGLALYSATKFAVRGLSEALDGEWAPEGIKVRVLMPSFIDTPLLDATSPGTNRTARESVRDAGLEFTPLDVVAKEVWDSIDGNKVHIIVGKTAKKLAFAARWMPGALRKQMRRRNLVE
jgi:NAD(P)-dependent dehydrogenase (short-subunit alcohol dehydrogenase family)